MTAEVVVLAMIILPAMLLAVYILRVLLRIVALRAAVAFFQAPGTNGNVIVLAKEMFSYLITGRPVKS